MLALRQNAVAAQQGLKHMPLKAASCAAAVDRVSTISSGRGRAVKLAVADGKLTLSATNPDSGSA
ncbi:protein of unknown function [Methylocella tundrae]|uniref:DNA polymerase III beta sliding clamp C-terminal domain-containing protein n=1 Tax=Methylocella tundrae TaxID=227605 RepID=A0A4V6IMM9_METTU|nr:protein of unknown function [Methylocella tundrae]